MRTYILLAVAALLGSAYSDNECFKSIFTACPRHVLNPHDMEKPPTLCNDFKNQMNCLVNEAYLCDMRFLREALQVNVVYDEVCTEGEYLHILFERERECYKQAIEDNDCNEPINEIFNHTTIDTIIRGNQEACGVLDFYENCVIQRVEEKCGVPTLDFFSYLFDAQVKLAKGVCHEVIHRADENDKSPHNLGLLNPLAIIKPLFVSE
ncbi:hypothetical protein AVEN_188297-1 [Araneus ventricosus]|uniref:DUF19 domain-containing protein n=1 Tax=Araneus ventricosus TaxID=182803 RepID=A0A4Y2JHG2_ARAVE|nr:hypothetical protein AVEN_188297-1 [Araneus ventricosus]